MIGATGVMKFLVVYETCFSGIACEHCKVVARSEAREGGEVSELLLLFIKKIKEVYSLHVLSSAKCG